MHYRNARLSLLVMGYSDIILTEGDAPRSANTPSPGGPVKDDWLCFVDGTPDATASKRDYSHLCFTKDPSYQLVISFWVSRLKTKMAAGTLGRGSV